MRLSRLEKQNVCGQKRNSKSKFRYLKGQIKSIFFPVGKTQIKSLSTSTYMHRNSFGKKMKILTGYEFNISNYNLFSTFNVTFFMFICLESSHTAKTLPLFASVARASRTIPSIYSKIFLSNK